MLFSAMQGYAAGETEDTFGTNRNVPGANEPGRGLSRHLVSSC